MSNDSVLREWKKSMEKFKNLLGFKPKILVRRVQDKLHKQHCLEASAKFLQISIVLMGVSLCLGPRLSYLGGALKRD